MTPGTKSGGGAEKDKHSAENDKNSAENDEIKVPKKSAETGGNQMKTSPMNLLTAAFIMKMISKEFFLQNQRTKTKM